MKLSILIPTIFGREKPFDLLVAELNRQCHEFGLWNEVEIVSEIDDREMSIGLKRNMLIDDAQGEYIVFIDDDDWISETYILDIWEALATNPDCVGFEQLCTYNGQSPVFSSISNQWDEWGEFKGKYRFVRTPFFPTPMRTGIARRIMYKDMRFGEDHDFSIRLKKSGLIKTEAYLDKVLYHYRYVYEPHKYEKPKK